MGKIATNAEVNAKIGSSLSPANKCPTKMEIMSTGLAEVPSRYSVTQCVQLSDVREAPFTLICKGTRGMVFWISQKTDPPMDPNDEWTLYRSGSSYKFYRDTRIGRNDSESFKFEENIYVTGSDGYSATVPGDSVVPNGTYSIGEL